MADRLWGANKTDEDLPFATTYGQGAPGLQVANATGGTVGAGSFTMPWAGSLTAAFTGVYLWQQNAHQQAQLHLGASSPGPTNYSALNQIAINDIGNMRGELPMYALWANLAKGQVVTFVIYLGVGGGGWPVTLQWWAGTVRAWAA
jgi:hypothetical protein